MILIVTIWKNEQIKKYIINWNFLFPYVNSNFSCYIKILFSLNRFHLNNAMKLIYCIYSEGLWMIENNFFFPFSFFFFPFFVVEIYLEKGDTKSERLRPCLKVDYQENEYCLFFWLMFWNWMHLKIIEEKKKKGISFL